MRNKSKLFVLGLLFIMSVLYILTPKETEEEKRNNLLDESRTIQSIEEIILKKNIEKADRFIEEINSKISINLLEEFGRYNITHDRTPENKWYSEWMFNSEIDLDLEYKALISLDYDNIKMTNAMGVVYVDMRLKDLEVKSIEILENILLTNKSFLGKSYSNEEVLSLMNIAKEHIKNNVINDNVLSLASKNFSTYIQNIADTMNVPVIINIY